jgi:glycosyltransferase involved in cell wall biosynthesis
MSLSKHKPAPVASRAKVILFVGRIHPEKGIELLVDAFAGATNATFEDWKMVVIGPAQSKFGGGGEQYLDDLKRRAQDRAVVFREPIFDPIALEEAYRSAPIFVYPSLAERGESFGLAPLEAMSQGCAALVSDLACFRDFISDNATGFVFNHRAARPAEALRQQLERVISDPTLLARVADAGYRKSADYSVSRVADQFLKDFAALQV